MAKASGQTPGAVLAPFSPRAHPLQSSRSRRIVPASGGGGRSEVCSGKTAYAQHRPPAVTGPIPLNQTRTQAPLPKARPDTADFVHDVFDHKHAKHLDAATLEGALTTLSTLYPTA